MSQTDDSAPVTPTDHPRVFYRTFPFNRGERKVAEEIADALDDEWDVHITMGPFRLHSIYYEIDVESRVVNLDFYSVRPCGDYDVKQVIRHIKRGIRNAT
jgi:hypothetical protein